MNPHKLIHPCYAEDLDEFGYHPAMEFPANNPYNGYSWSSWAGIEIDEAAARMNMVSAYATFYPSDEFRSILDASASRLVPDTYGGQDYLRYVQGSDAGRDHCLMLMGL